VVPQSLPVQRLQSRVPRSVEKAAREIRNRMQVLGLAAGVDITFDEEGGLLISLPSAILFDFGKADLRPEAYEVINQLASSLSSIEGVFMEVRGHTDNVPLGPQSPFGDNYDLSYHRSKNVMVQLTGPGGIAERNCEVVACGPSQPVADNNTEEGRQTNRRVELYVRGKPSAETLEDVTEKLGAGRSQPPRPARSPSQAVPEGV
jgi:chemotaxis protein MotB